MKFATTTTIDGVEKIGDVYLYDPRPDVPATEIPDDVFSGDVADGLGGWTRPVPDTPRLVPLSVALWRARAILRTDGLIDAADAAVAASGNAALIEAWQYGNEIARASPGLASLAAALGLTGSQVDDMFVRADALVV